MRVITKTKIGPMHGTLTTGGGGHGMRALFRSFVRCLRASVAVELALLTPVLMLMLVGVIDFGGAVNERMKLTSAARAGVQFANQSAANADDTAGILQAVQNAGGLDTANITIETTQFCACGDGSAATCGDTCAGGGAAGTYVSILVKEQYTTIFPGLIYPSHKGGGCHWLDGRIICRELVAD